MSVQSGYAAAIPSAEFRLTSSDGLHGNLHVAKFRGWGITNTPGQSISRESIFTLWRFPAKPLSLAIVLTPLRRHSANISKTYNWPQGCTFHKALSSPASSKSQPLQNEMKIHPDSTALTQGA